MMVTHNRKAVIRGIVALLLVMVASSWRGASAQTPEPSASPKAANVRVSQDNAPIHAEPSVAVNPADPTNLLAASQLISDSGLTGIGTFASFDGGQTWRDNGAMPFPAGANTGDDVTVAFDGAGHGFVAAMATAQSAAGMSQIDRGLYVWRTDDGGRSFAPPVAVIAHQFVDHPWLAVGPDDGTVYAVWVMKDHKGLGFSRSSDGGRSFDPAMTIANPPGRVSIPVIAAGSRGTIYAAYETGINGADSFASDEDGLAANALSTTQSSLSVDAKIEVVASTDGGRSFGEPVVTTPVPSEPSPAPGIRLPTGPSIAVDHHGGLDVVFAAPRPNSAQLVVWLARQPAPNQPFTAPVRVDQTPDGDPASFFQPQIVVDRAGMIDVTAFVLRDQRVDVVLWRSPGPAGAFGAGESVASQPFDPAMGMAATKHGAWWIGDYQGLAAGGGAIHPLWNDTRTGNLELFTAAISAEPASAVTSDATPRATPAASLATAVQATSDPAYPDHAEPSIAVDPTNPRHLLGAAEFFDQPGPNAKPGVFVSFDGGATWTGHAVLALPQGVVLANDLTVAFDPRGTAFVSAGLGAVSGEGGIAIWRSDDGGRSFGPPLRVAATGADHPWLAIDPGPGPDAGTLYLAWAGPGHRELLFSRSTDGGRSFETPRPISGPRDVRPGLSVVTVGPSGHVAVVYGTTEVVVSTDAGLTFSAPRTLPDDLAAQSANVAGALDTLPAAASDPRTGELYVALSERAAATGRWTVRLWRTTDGGLSWSGPTSLPLNATQPTDAYQPAVAVNSAGLVALSAYLVRQAEVSVVVALSTDHGATLGSAQPIGLPFDPAADLKPESLGHFKQTGLLAWIGDYQGLAAGPDAIHPCWTDTSTGHMEIMVGTLSLVPGSGLPSS